MKSASVLSCRGNVSVSNRLLKHIDNTSQHTWFPICVRGLLHSGPIGNLGQTKIKATRGFDNVTACVQLPGLLRHAGPRLSPHADTLQRTPLRGISLHAVDSLCILTSSSPPKKKTVPVWYKTCALSPCVSHVKKPCAWKAARLPAWSRYPCRCAESFREDSGGTLEALQSEFVEFQWNELRGSGLGRWKRQRVLGLGGPPREAAPTCRICCNNRKQIF